MKQSNKPRPKYGKRLMSSKSHHMFFETIRQVDWRIECLKAILTSFMFLVVSTAVFWCITKISPGEYSGEKLDTYLLHQVAENIGIDFDAELIILNHKEIFDVGTNDQMILMCGSYKDTVGSPLSGRFICIFERSPKGFWNDLVGTAPRYAISFSRVSKETYYWDEALDYQNCSYADLDGDGSKDLTIHYRTNFADRCSDAWMFIKQIDAKWTVITPDFSTIEEEITTIAGEEHYIMLDFFEFYDPTAYKTSPDIIYGQSHHGSIYHVKNPLWGGFDMLYCIAVNDGTTGLLLTDKSAYIMVRLTERGMVRDSNWNNGEIHYTSEADFNPQIDIDKRWGLKTSSGIIFYGGDME